MGISKWDSSGHAPLSARGSVPQSLTEATPQPQKRVGVPAGFPRSGKRTDTSESTLSDRQARLLRISRSLAGQSPTCASADLCSTVRFLDGMGISRRLLELASRNALSNDTTAAEELICVGRLTSDAYYRSLAEHAGIRFVTEDDISSILFGLAEHALCLQPNAPVWARLQSGEIVMLAAPQRSHLRLFARTAGCAQTDAALVMTTPEIIRAKVVACAGTTICETETFKLAAAAPGESARTGPSFAHGLVITLFGLFVLAGFALQPFGTGFAIIAALSLFFIACVIVRLSAMLGYTPHVLPAAPRVERAPSPAKATIRPVYSVLVSLYREADVVPDLVAQLKALKWPHSKLEIKLVCEADDEPTIEALKRQSLDGRFEIIAVPPVGPRTKPKALAYALPFTSGTYITLYDAEDRPHPEQLEEAFRTFEQAPPELACLQAPLEIANRRRNALTRLFHLEYSGLFHGLLPWLARRGFPLPLGGTSNHFRREALTAAGGWDPFNVTEDADLGFRLARRGYRSGTITRATLEDAPHAVRVWIPQRTRWFKGWMQTWIVNTRNTAASLRTSSWLSFLISHVFLTGLIASALLHPLIFVNAAVLTFWVAAGLPHNASMMAIVWIEWYVLLLSYITFFGLSWQATPARDRRSLWPVVPLIPAYWLLMSFAAWRALFQMFKDPFTWEKTPHAPHWAPDSNNENLG